ncbi:unnamed protein product [Lampetra planeri]
MGAGHPEPPLEDGRTRARERRARVGTQQGAWLRVARGGGQGIRASKQINPPAVSSDGEAEQDVVPPTALVAGGPSPCSDNVLQSENETMVSPTLPPPPQSWLDIAGHLGRLLLAAIHLFEPMMAASTTGYQDELPAAVVSEATGVRDLAAISGAAAALPKSAILRD